MKTFSVVGVGRLGGALALALHRAGYVPENLVYHRRIPDLGLPVSVSGGTRFVQVSEIEHIYSDLLLISTPDGSISTAAESVRTKLAENTVVLHTSGALGSDVLRSLADNGNPTGSLHPLVSVSDPQAGSASFRGRYFCIEGTAEAIAAASEITDSLGGIPFAIASDRKPLYHAAASMASGHLIALIETSIACLIECGVDRETAKRMLLSLSESTMANLSSQEPESALTGPFARADVDTLRSHIKALDELGLIDEREVYLSLGRKALELAEKAGVDSKSAAAVRDLITMAKARAK